MKRFLFLLPIFILVSNISWGQITIDDVGLHHNQVLDLIYPSESTFSEKYDIVENYLANADTPLTISESELQELFSKFGNCGLDANCYASNELMSSTVSSQIINFFQSIEYIEDYSSFTKMLNIYKRELEQNQDISDDDRMVLVVFSNVLDSSCEYWYEKGFTSLLDTKDDVFGTNAIFAKAIKRKWWKWLIVGAADAIAAAVGAVSGSSGGPVGAVAGAVALGGTVSGAVAGGMGIWDGTFGM